VARLSAFPSSRASCWGPARTLGPPPVSAGSDTNNGNAVWPMSQAPGKGKHGNVKVHRAGPSGEHHEIVAMDDLRR
jgi:hypothetical protein